MSQTTRSSYLTTAVTSALLYGIAAGLVGGLWCVAGAGMYGSPFSSASGTESLFYGAFIVTGPLVALVAGLLSLAKPRGAARLLLLGGIVSLGLAVPMISSDAHVIPLCLVSLPMLVLGGVLLHASRSSQAMPETVQSSTAPPLTNQQVVSILVSAGLFFVSLVGMFVFTGYLTIENVLGFRTQPVVFGMDNEKLPDTYVVLTLAGLSLLLVPVVKALHLRWSWLVGMWMALALALLIVWVR